MSPRSHHLAQECLTELEASRWGVVDLQVPIRVRKSDLIIYAHICTIFHLFVVSYVWILELCLKLQIDENA